MKIPIDHRMRPGMYGKVMQLLKTSLLTQKQYTLTLTQIDADKIQLDIVHSTSFLISDAAIQRCSYEKVFWKYVANLLENTKCGNAISIKLLCNFIEITLRHGCSPANSLHIFRTPFLKNISGWPLLSFNNLIKGVCFLRDNKTVIGRGDDGYQIYSVSQSNIQLVGYYLSRLNKFWYPPSPCSITV